MPEDDASKNMADSSFRTADEAELWKSVYLAYLRSTITVSHNDKAMTLTELADSAVLLYRKRRKHLDASGPYR